MMWIVCLILSMISFVTVVVGGHLLDKKKIFKKQITSVTNILLVACFLGLSILIFPVGFYKYQSGFDGIFNSIAIAIQNTMQIFGLDGDYDAFRDGVLCENVVLRRIIFTYGAFLFVAAPISLIGTVISFFKDFLYYIDMYIKKYDNVYIFSELSEKAVLLAEDCYKKAVAEKERNIIIFTDVFEQETEESYELIQRAKKINALCLKKDFLFVNHERYKRCKKLMLFVIGEDETENLHHTLNLLKQKKLGVNASIYLFSRCKEHELVINSTMGECETTANIYRVNEVQTVIYNYLYNHNLFEEDFPKKELPNGDKLLSVGLVGMGSYGTEWLKALCWYGQMPGYQLEIHVFDKDEYAKEYITSECPELIRMNGNTLEGEAKYNIIFHKNEQGKGIDARTGTFDQKVVDIGHISMFIVALGNDELNMQISIKLRTLFSRHVKECKPVICSIMYNGLKSNLLVNSSLKNFKGVDYEIEYFGNIGDLYTYKAIINSDLESAAMEEHMRWSKDEPEEKQMKERMRYYRYEYYRKSSITRVIRTRVRKSMEGIPMLKNIYAKEDRKSRTKEERLYIQRIEHCGWNAYTRSEGYCRAEIRDDLAKTHNLLISFDELPEKEKDKDED